MKADALPIGSSRQLAQVRARYVESAQLGFQVKVNVDRLAIVVDDPHHARARNVLVEPRYHARGADADSGPQAGPAHIRGRQPHQSGYGGVRRQSASYRSGDSVRHSHHNDELGRPERSSGGDQVDFRFTVSNPGTLALTDVQVDSALPDGLHFEGASGGGAIDAETGIRSLGVERRSGSWCVNHAGGHGNDCRSWPVGKQRMLGGTRRSRKRGH
jgi:uncharacterized repeat protein (TIGR01451 family)